MSNTNRQKSGVSPSGSKPKSTVSRPFKSPVISSQIKVSKGLHLKPMEKKEPDSYLSEKEKFLKKNKDNMIDREVVKNG